jgi:hypothetical protein
MDTSKEMNDPYVKKDLHMLGLTVLIIAIVFGTTAFLDAKTTIIRDISSKLHLATLKQQ